MRIKIKDKTICETCTRNTCSMNNVVQKPQFFNLKTEQFVCPVRLLKREVLDVQLNLEYIDVPPNKNEGHPEECVYCCLCVAQCFRNNLEIIDYEYSYDSVVTSLFSEPVGNIVATSYLNCLYDFSANTNIIKPLHFDGYICTAEDVECFVEIDLHDDSLESCRRILTDIVTYNHNNSKKIYNGLIVLSKFPKEGTRDVYSQIECINKFPNTSKLKIYFTTLSLLRYFVINNIEKNITFEKLFYDIGKGSKEEYLKMLIDNNYLTEEIAPLIF